MSVVVDLRSDTVTRPTQAMRRAMSDAEVGDDQYGEDPTVNLLQDTFAELVGKDSALLVPSGTMGNQIAMRVLARPGDAVVVGARQHIVLYELGAAAANAGISWLALPDADGALEAPEVQRVIISARHHQPATSVVAVEDTHMAAGGKVWDLAKLQEVADIAGNHGLSVHLDGARLWHAAIASGQKLAERAGPATTLMCCLSKGLGAPVGSLFAGPAEIMERAVVERQRLGGAMRQAGVLAAAGLVAIREGFDRLAEDHARSRRLAEAVAERWPDIGLDVEDVQTNIVVFTPPDPEGLLEHLRGEGVLAGMIAPGVVRFVTHRDVDDDGIEAACLAMASFPGS